MVRFLIEFGHVSKSNGHWGSAKISSIPLKLDDLNWKLKSEHRSRVFSRAQSQRSLMGLATNIALRIESGLLEFMTSKGEKQSIWGWAGSSVELR